MICKNCGAQLPDGVAFCTNCGTAVEAPQPQAQPAQPQYQAPAQPAQPQYQAQPAYQQPVYQQPMYAQPILQQPNLLVLGILSLVFCETGIVGLILAIVARSKGKKFLRQGGQLTGAAKVGYILALVGLIFSICYIAFWAIYVILIIVGAVGGALSEISRYY